jgi:hypothetical protein
VSQSAEVDAARERALFTLEFDAVPDFHTVGEFGQQKDAFQYEIDGDGAAEDQLTIADIDAVVRGEEIHAVDALRIRARGSRRRAGSGSALRRVGSRAGDRPVRPSRDRADVRRPARRPRRRSVGRRVSYSLVTTDFGATTSRVFGRAVPIPLPPGGWAGAATASGYALLWALRRKR